MENNTRKTRVARFYNALFSSKRYNGLSPRHSRAFLSGGFARSINGFARKVAFSSTKTYAAAFLSFGLLTILLHLVSTYISAAEKTLSLPSLLISAGFALVSLPLFLTDKPMCIALQEFSVTDYVFFEFFAIKRLNEEQKVKGLPIIVGVIAGAVPAIPSFFFGTPVAALAVCAVLFLIITFISPEFPFMFTILALPYFSTLPAAPALFIGLSAISLLSFFRKVILGKRYYAFGISDILILVFALIVLITGLSGGGEGAALNTWALVFTTLMYIPAGNIIVNRRLADCAENAVMFSAIPVSAVAVIQYVAGGFAAPSSTFFATTTELAVFLCVAVVFVAFALHDVQSAVQRGVYIGILILCVAALVCTECVLALAVAIFAVPAYFVIMNKWLPKEILIIILMLPLAIFFVPDRFLSPISNLLNMSAPLENLDDKLYTGTDLMMENLVGGLGAATADYAISYLGLICRFGIFSAAVMLLLVMVRLRQISVYSTYTLNSSLLNLSGLSTLALFVMLAFGWFTDIFSSVGLYGLLFLLFGMNTAALRISKSEYDDQTAYFADQKRFESSVATITLKG